MVQRGAHGLEVAQLEQRLGNRRCRPVVTDG